MARVHVALGSNLGHREATLTAACDALRSIATTTVFDCSPFHETQPMGPQDQPDYVNAVCRFDTTFEPEPLLDQLQRIEMEAGRVRTGERWIARTLDLDLLLYDDRRVSTPRLTVPHAGIAERLFVLRPLVDLDPDIEIPGHGRASHLLARLVEAER